MYEQIRKRASHPDIISVTFRSGHISHGVGVEPLVLAGIHILSREGLLPVLIRKRSNQHSFHLQMWWVATAGLFGNRLPPGGTGGSECEKRHFCDVPRATFQHSKQRSDEKLLGHCSLGSRAGGVPPFLMF